MHALDSRVSAQLLINPKLSFSNQRKATASSMANGNKNTSIHSSQQIHDENWYKSTWAQRAWFASGCAAVLITLARSAMRLPRASPATPRTWLQLTFAALLGYILSDLGSGIYHWAVDNYGTADTPIFGPQIESFRAHHQHPSEITKCETAGILYTLAQVVVVAVLPINLFSDDPVFLAFVGALAGCGMFSLKFHALAHTPRRKLPPLVAALQEAGILLRWSEHTKHHRPPYNSDYCTVSGIWNRVLDESKVLVSMEVALFRATGVKPRCWSEPNSVWSQLKIQSSDKKQCLIS